MNYSLRLFFVFFISGIFCICSEAKEKKIYAHYMGCYPVGSGPTRYHRSQLDKGIRRKPPAASLGGGIINWDLVPQGSHLNAEESAELDIRRAIRGGIDGFAVDAWAGSMHAKKTMDALFKVAEEKQLPFKITICLDPNCLFDKRDKQGERIYAFAEAVKYLLRHKESPNLARRDGKPLIFGYHSRGILRNKQMRKLPEGPEKWDKIADAYKQVEKLVGEPFYFYFGLGAFFHRVPRNKMSAGGMVAAAGWAGKNFPAVGSFLDNSFFTKTKEVAQAVKSTGAEWGQPLWHQYNNRRSLSVFIDDGLNILRSRWKMARELDSTLIQFITWNDYGEDTVLAPGYNTGYTVLEINKYYIDWWKNGKAPLREEDKMFLIYRRYEKDYKTFPFPSRRFKPGVFEIVTILKAPAKVILSGRNIEYNAPAGIFFKQFPLKIGKVSAKLKRNSETVISLDAPELITDKPFRQDNSMVCFSSEFETNWQKDFKEQKPFYYSEYGDIDNDGLPNWFEMFWFGKHLDFKTATVAQADADPDKDGLTNLQEYLAQSDPTKPKAKYAPGNVWDMSTVYKNNASFNPDVDFNDTPVWYYMYKHGHRGKTERDGRYQLCPSSQQKTPYTGPLVHLSPTKAEGFKYIHGWICRNKTKDGRWQLILRPRVQVMLILGWKSPINGTIKIEGKIVPVKGQDGITFEIAKGIENLYKKAIDVGQGDTFKIENVNIKKGEFIYFISDCMPGYDTSVLVFDELKITLDKLN